MSNGYKRYYRLGIEPNRICDVELCNRPARTRKELCGVDGRGLGEYKFFCQQHWNAIVEGYWFTFKENK